jgi:hypothetical protein
MLLLLHVSARSYKHELTAEHLRFPNIIILIYLWVFNYAISSSNCIANDTKINE